MSILYGHTVEVQEKVRAYDGLGCLHTRIRLAKIASSCGVQYPCSIQPESQRMFIVTSHAFLTCLTLITPFPPASTSPSACLRSMRGALIKIPLRWPPISTLVKTRRSSKLHGWLTVAGSDSVRVVSVRLDSNMADNGCIIKSFSEIISPQFWVLFGMETVGPWLLLTWVSIHHC